VGASDVGLDKKNSFPLLAAFIIAQQSNAARTIPLSFFVRLSFCRAESNKWCQIKIRCVPFVLSAY